MTLFQPCDTTNTLGNLQPIEGRSIVRPGRKIMQVAKRDIIASGFVFAAVVVYMLWDADSALPGLSATRATGLVVLAFGVAASATAVVPGFDQLLHGNKIYLAVTALIGLVGLVGGVQMLIAGSDTGLAVVMIAMVALWFIATLHHTLLAADTSRSVR